ncbi:MAG: hypothetical protein K2O24_02545, partial [Muribaculaceae bacterium]|nr:hypothetical protein [Muribaculaceae bacterium]
ADPAESLSPGDESLSPGVPEPSKLIVSALSDPFHFPLESVTTISSGRILALSSAARPLSQGQFGQFPLYAFTTDGIWALEISATGTYTARQPITRDVCLSPRSITQIDSAVLFATRRGIMLLSGSQTQCISDIITDHAGFDIRTLPECPGIPALPLVPFLDFISSCGMAYDYPRQRIIVFNKTYPYAYIYSLKSKQWGMTLSAIARTLNSYPEALATDTAGNLIDLSGDAGHPQTALLVTRPIKLGAPDVLKTIDTLIQRGQFRTGHIKTILYGSRDLYSWHLLSSSVTHRLCRHRGTPYKYFRIALLCHLDKDETLCGATVQYTPRLTNRIR